MDSGRRKRSKHRTTAPCPVCETPLPVRFTHRGKPYLVCDPCGVQVFVRRKEGIERFFESANERRDAG